MSGLVEALREAVQMCYAAADWCDTDIPEERELLPGHRARAALLRELADRLEAWRDAYPDDGSDFDIAMALDGELLSWLLEAVR